MTASLLSTRNKTLLILGGVLVALLAAGPAHAGLNVWTTGGPAGAVQSGLGHTMAVDPQNPATLYVATFSGGIFKSTDGGVSWTAVNNGIPTSTNNAVALAVDPQTPSTVYASLVDSAFAIGGIFKTTDGGASWAKMSTGLPQVGFQDSFQNLAVDPQTPSIIYAANSGPPRVFKSTDGGGHWTEVSAGLAGTTAISVVAIDPQTPSTLYAGTSTGGVFKSTNGGASWAPVVNGLTALFVFDLAIDPQAPGTIYAGTVSGGVFKSTDGGATWGQVNAGLTDTFVHGLAIDPASPSSIYAGTSSGGVFKSTDGGGSWAPMNAGLTGTVQSLAISPSGTCLHAAITNGPVFDFATQVSPCAPLPPPPPSTTLVAAVLPSSRSVQVGNTATAFATIINTGPNTAFAVGITLASAIPASFTYNQTDCATNAVIGGSKVPVDIAVGGQACYVIAITPTAPFAPTEVQFNFAGTNTAPVAVLIAINTLLMSASPTPVPDIVALAATATNDGILHIPGAAGTGAFAVATANVGISAVITASANTGATVVPLALSICQTDPVSGVCISAIGPSVTVPINAGATPTFAIFATASGTIVLDPAVNRIFVVFVDSGSVIRGRTSVAVTTQ